MEKLFKISNNIVKYCFSFFIFIFSICNIFFTAKINELESNTVVFNNGLSVINIFIVLIMLLFLYILIKNNFFNINEKYFLSGFLLLSIIVGLIWVFINDPVIKEAGDSYNCFQAAKKIASGNYDPLGYATYVSVYPNNIGFITYLIILIKIFGESITLYLSRIINIVFVLLGYLSLYGICKLQFKNNRIVNCTLIYILFFSLQFVFYSFMIYGNCISYSLALISVYFLLKYFSIKKSSYLFLSSIAIIGAITIKENSLIILIAEIIYLLLYLLKTKKFIIIFAILLSLIGSYCGTTGLQQFWGNTVGVNYGETRLPTICWLAYGVNYDERKPGGYMSQFEVYHVTNDYKAEYTSLEAKTFIVNTLSRFKEKPSVALKFYFQKFLISWADPQYDCLDGYRQLDNSTFIENVLGGSINNCLYNIWDGASTIISLGLVFYLIKRFNNLKLEELLGAVIVLGGFFFHLVWEVKSIYLYQYFMYLLPYAAYGLSLMFKGHKNEE